VGDGRLALRRIAERRPDLVVLDLMLPGVNGFEVCRRLREEPRVPTIMLSARGDESARVMGLELGADDYVVKPFSPRELVARVRSVLRRVGEPSKDADQPLVAGDLELDPKSHRVRAEGSVRELTALEFQLLAFFMRHPGRVFSREELLQGVWGYGFGGTSTVTVHVQRLRGKIESDPANPMWIRTVWGVGYRFDA